MPKVSIIVPTYNVEPYLCECLDSIVNQTLQDIEIICVDDGSTDNSGKILDKYAKKDKRIKVIHKENSGAASARNYGLKKAKGEYVAFLDSDDWVENTYYEKLYKATNNGKYDVAATSNVEIIEKNKTFKKQMGLDNETYLINKKEKRSKIFVATGATWNKIYKKSFIENNKLYFADTVPTGEDNSLTILAMILANKISVINTTKYFYRKVNSSLTNSVKNNKNFAIVDVYYNVLNQVKNLKTKHFDKKYYLKEINKRRNSDILLHYNQMQKKFKKPFVEYISKKFPNENIVPIAKNLIISLTSFPARINTVHLTIESLLNQTLQPEKIVLWLNKYQFPKKEKNLPKDLLKLINDTFKINWYSQKKDIKSYNKLVNSIKEYTDKILVTADDDIIYPQNWLTRLFDAYIKEPNLIHCHRIHRMRLKNNYPLPYRQWVWEISNVKPSFNNFLTGVGGVLYPPNCFYKDVLREDLFTKLCPNADDIWFWAMAVLNNVKINVVENNISKLKYVQGTQDGDCLWKTNCSKSQNDAQLQKVLEYYPEIMSKIDKSNSDHDTNTFIQNIFSIRHNFSKTHHIITVLWIKFRIRKEFIQKIFSVTSYKAYNNTWHRIIWICGIRISFRNKQKEIIDIIHRLQKENKRLYDAIALQKTELENQQRYFNNKIDKLKNKLPKHVPDK